MIVGLLPNNLDNYIHFYQVDSQINLKMVTNRSVFYELFVWTFPYVSNSFVFIYICKT